jgi:hypothetical protein
MKKTFNYTGRRKIERKDVSVVLREDRGAWVFEADLRLAEYRFPRNAEVWVEAHRQNLWMQFAWGTVSAIRPPLNRRLTEFDVPDGVLFRVRVVQPPGAEHHKLLGEADGIPFIKVGEANAATRPLLEPVPDALDQVLWKLDIESDPPRLLVNKDAQPTWKEMARTSYFTSLVYPEVFRQLLTYTLITDQWSEEDEDSGWEADWVRFARNIGGLATPPPVADREGRQAWIDEAVSAFARRHQLKQAWDLNFGQDEHQ